jgi:molybdopterin-binding protein
MSPTSEELLRPRDAALVLGISYASLKQWIYKGKLRTVRTAGGHHRIPQSELDRYLYKSLGKQPAENRTSFRSISGRNQLVGRIVEVRIEGLLAQVKLSIGGQHITSIITADAAREMRLKRGDKLGRVGQVHRGDDCSGVGRGHSRSASAVVIMRLPQHPLAAHPRPWPGSSAGRAQP